MYSKFDILGAWTVANGTTYEAESGVRGGSSTLITNSGFSGGHGIGYLGKANRFFLVILSDLSNFEAMGEL